MITIIAKIGVVTLTEGKPFAALPIRYGSL